jgi:hypothetical protein
MQWFIGLVLALPAGLAGQVKSVDRQIAEAVTALPEGERGEATVYGYRGGSNLATIIRRGSNNFVCLADVPGDERFQISCYHKGLDPFMAMGRELRAEGMEQTAVMQHRMAAIQAGTLVIPPNSVLYSHFGVGDINATTGVPDSVATLSVLYTPGATAESTGLPERRGATGEPWLMQSGMHRAHVMIGGPRKAFELAQSGN